MIFSFYVDSLTQSTQHTATRQFSVANIRAHPEIAVCMRTSLASTATTRYKFDLNCAITYSDQTIARTALVVIRQHMSRVAQLRQLIKKIT